MTLFPSKSIKSLEKLEKIFNAIPEDGISPKELREKVGAKNQGEIYPELSLLIYLGKVKRKGFGKNLKYYKIATALDLEKSLLSFDEPFRAFAYILAKRKTRKDVANWVYKNENKTNLNRITAMMKVGRLLNLVITAGGYKIKKESSVKIFERVLEEIYFKKVKESGIDVVDIGTLRSEFAKLIPDLKDKDFDRLMLKLAEERDDILLHPAPAADETIYSVGIKTPNGVLYHLQIKSSKWCIQ